MEEKQETKSGTRIRNFSRRIRNTASDLIAGIKKNRQETKSEYGTKQETGKEERKGKIGQLQMRTAAGAISLLCFCCLPVIAAETMQPEGETKTATVSEATASEAVAFELEGRTGNGTTTKPV